MAGKEFGVTKFFVDKWKRIWFRIDKVTVYSDECGYGGWFNGSGLQPLRKKKKNK